MRLNIIKNFKNVIFNNKIVTLLIILSIVSCRRRIVDESVIMGLWEGIYNKKYISINFMDSNECEIIFENDEEELIEKIKGNYEIDFSKNPIPLSIRNISKLNHPLYTIIDLMNKDEIRIAKFGDRWKLRPISFNIDEYIILKRIQTGLDKVRLE